MDIERFGRLKELVARAIELPRGERSAFLDSACGTDGEMRREAESLLSQHETIPSFLPDESPAALADALAAALVPDDPLPRIGPYVLHTLLGEGGMGVVYAATQEEPLRREVAVKLVADGPLAARVLERFELERRAVARLDHPAIARVFDAGTAPDGRPYFVMELVAGRSITEFADAERLSVRERLELVLAVCAGVQHAHQRGVIHRDLKPSNILVTRGSEGPRPHIIDFGIARALDDPADRRLTHVGHLLGTPDYMSPEQAGVIDGDADTRADVYALGVVLYEMLAGARPYRFTRPTAAEIHRVLTGPPPRRPSAAVTDDPAGVAAARARRTHPKRLRRLLRGDLDNVVLKALAREPDQRYESVEQLARDVRRHLSGLPVEARAATLRYRSAKFVKRHTAAVVGAASVVLLLAAFAAVTARQARALADERDRARREAETARQVSRFLVEMFEDADPAQSKGDRITAREILDRGADRVRRELAHQPAVRARLLSTMGGVYVQLGRYEDAGTLLEEALAQQKALPSPDPEDLAATFDNLSDLAHDMRDMEQSEAYARQSLDLRRQTLGPDHPEVATGLVNLAIAVRGRGRLEEAERLYREAIALGRRVFPPDDPWLGWALFHYAWALHQQGRLDEAEPLYLEAATLQRRLLGDTHPDLRDTLNSLAGVYFQRGQYDRAGATWKEALEMCERLHGETHPATARAVHNLANVPLALGDYERAEELTRRAVAINRAAIGNGHPNTASTEERHGIALWRLGRLEEAERELRAALAVREKTAGKASHLTGATLAALARVVLDAGRPDEALLLARRAATIGAAQADRWPTASAGMIESLAAVEAFRGRPVEAAALWRRALALREGTQDSGPVPCALTRVGLAESVLESGDPRGRQELRAAATVLDALLPPGHPERERVRRLLEAPVAGSS